MRERRRRGEKRRGQEARGEQRRGDERRKGGGEVREKLKQRFQNFEPEGWKNI